MTTAAAYVSGPPSGPDRSGVLPNDEPVTDGRAFELTGAETFWYILQCIARGMGYFLKIPTKKALCDAGLACRSYRRNPAAT